MADINSQGYRAGAELARQFMTQQNATPAPAELSVSQTAPAQLAPQPSAPRFMQAVKAGADAGREAGKRVMYGPPIGGVPGPGSGVVTNEEFQAAGKPMVAGAVRLGSAMLPGGPVVQGLRSAAGEALAQEIESGKIESPGQVALAGAVPPGVEGIRLGRRAVTAYAAKRLPGAAKILQEEAVASARNIPKKFDAPAIYQRAETLYNQVEKLNPRIATDNLRDAVNTLMLEEMRTPKALQGPLRSVVEGLSQLMKEHEGQVPFQELRATLKRLGQRTGSIQGLEANEVRGGFKHLTAAIQADLDVAAEAGGKQAGRAAGLLRQANAAYARGKAVDELAEAIEGAVNKGRADLAQSFNPARALNELADSPNLPKTFTPQELEDIGNVLRKFKSLPSLPPPSGEAAVGSGRIITRLLIGGGLGSAGGSTVAGPVGAAVGMAAGAAAANALHSGIAQALTTPQGRAMLTRALEANSGTLPPSVVPKLIQAGRAAMLAKATGEAK